MDRRGLFVCVIVVLARTWCCSRARPREAAEVHGVWLVLWLGPTWAVGYQFFRGITSAGVDRRGLSVLCNRWGGVSGRRQLRASSHLDRAIILKSTPALWSLSLPRHSSVLAGVTQSFVQKKTRRPKGQNPGPRVLVCVSVW